MSCEFEMDELKYLYVRDKVIAALEGLNFGGMPVRSTSFLGDGGLNHGSEIRKLYRGRIEKKLAMHQNCSMKTLRTQDFLDPSLVSVDDIIKLVLGDLG